MAVETIVPLLEMGVSGDDVLELIDAALKKVYTNTHVHLGQMIDFPLDGLKYEIFPRQISIPDLYGLQLVVHVAGWEPYGLHDL